MDFLTSKKQYFNPWTNVYGLARSIIATSTFLTLLLNKIDILFYSASAYNARNTDVTFLFNLNFFNLFHGYHELSKIVALLLLFLVIIGWRPMIMGVFHTWLTLSFMQSCPFIDGGDQICQILSILILPICLLDTRKWHWNAAESNVISNNIYVRIFFNYYIFIIRLQVALVYLNSATAKFGVNEWVDGSAVWYWFKEPTVGYNRYFGYLLDPILDVPLFIALISWGAIIFELLLAAALFMERKYWKYFLVSGIFFHFLILFIFGLGSFSTAMFGALVLYLRPFNQTFNFSKIINLFKSWRFKSTTGHTI